MEWTNYFQLVDGTFWGKEADFNKLPTSVEEEATLKNSGIFAIATDNPSAFRVWDAIHKEWN